MQKIVVMIVFSTFCKLTLFAGDYINNYIDILPVVEKECNNGDFRSCNNLGEMWFLGKGTHKDLNKAEKFFKKACEGGNFRGCSNLGDVYSRPEIGNYVKAKELYEISCNSNVYNACRALSFFYLNGIGGVKQNALKSIELFQKSCNRGDALSCHILGDIYSNIIKDYDKSKEYYKIACKKGYETSCSESKRAQGKIENDNVKIDKSSFSY